jgi:alkaline phosphatase
MKVRFLFVFACSSLLFACKAQPPKSATSAVAPEVEVTSATSALPRNIILMIGDGMGTSQIYGGMIGNHNQLHLERFKHMGFIKTYSFDNIITDSGAGATAFSIGKKTYNNAIGVDADTLAHETVLETAAKAGKATGVVATCAITHATPASFVAHVAHREMHESMAWEFVHSPLQLFIGGGRKYFDQRKDGRDLMAELRMRGFHTVTDELAMLEVQPQAKLAALLWEDAPSKKNEGRNDILPRATSLAIERLSLEKKGFFLMVEGSQIDWGGHANETDYIVQEMIDFDQAIGRALDFARKDGETLVIVTADHETGGFAIAGGDFETGAVKGAFTSTKHTAVMVPVFAYGPGAALFTGIQENISIYSHIMQLWGLTPSRGPIDWRAIVRE